MNESAVQYRVPARVNAAEAAQLYVEASWMKEADAGSVEKMLAGTFAVSAAYYEGKLIGFMRALSDGVSDAYLLDLIVTKKFRGHGVGAQIVKNLTEYLHDCGVDWCCCIGVPGTEKFYKEGCDGNVMEGFTPFRFE